MPLEVSHYPVGQDVEPEEHQQKYLVGQGLKERALRRGEGRGSEKERERERGGGRQGDGEREIERQTYRQPDRGRGVFKNSRSY